MKTSPARARALADHLWALVKLNGDKPSNSQDPIGAHLVFIADGPCIAGSTGCDRLVGGYGMTADGAITLATFTPTMMARPNMVIISD